LRGAHWAGDGRVEIDLVPPKQNTRHGICSIRSLIVVGAHRRTVCTWRESLEPGDSIVHPACSRSVLDKTSLARRRPS
jgi:hypothetical protein